MKSIDKIKQEYYQTQREYNQAIKRYNEWIVNNHPDAATSRQLYNRKERLWLKLTQLNSQLILRK